MIADRFGNKSLSFRIMGRSCKATRLPMTSVSTPDISWMVCRKRVHVLVSDLFLEERTNSRTVPRFSGRRSTGFPAKSCVGCPRTVIVPPSGLGPITARWKSEVILHCSSVVLAIPGRESSDEGNSSHSSLPSAKLFMNRSTREVEGSCKDWRRF